MRHEEAFCERHEYDGGYKARYMRVRCRRLRHGQAWLGH